MNPRTLGIGLVSLVATVGAAALLARPSTQGGGGGAPAPAPGSDPSVPQPDPGSIRYRYESDVIFTPWILATAGKLAEVFPGFLVTSGYRSPKAQAQAMEWLRTSGGYDRTAFLALYGASDEIIGAIYDALVSGDLKRAVQILEANPISAHMRGEAFDAHRGPGALPTGSTQDQQKAADDQYASAFLAAAKSAGIRAIDEGRGHALHVGA